MWQEVRFSTMTVLLTTQSERQCLDQAAMTRRLKEREGEKEKARTKQRERERDGLLFMERLAPTR